MLDIKELWDKCLAEIEIGISRANFNTWFKNTSILKEDGGKIVVNVPNEFVKDWLDKKYHKTIIKTIMNFAPEVKSVEYLISKTKNKDSGLIKEEPKLFINKELPLADLYVNKEDNLNPRYVFENFVVGSFNELAYAAAQAIIKNPGVLYNPFFVYGATGIGKTHLIQAIGNAIKIKHPNKKVNYITQEKFAVDFVNSVQNNKGNIFKEKYRKYDVLIMDDLQFIGNKEKTQEELFHLFNSFHENNKQIIFSSDRHPNYIPGLEDRLKSRCSQGMIVDINEPEYESRVALLKAKASNVGIIIPDEIIEYVASVIEGNVRELEGSLNTIVCQAKLKNRNLSLNEVKTLIKNNIKPKKNISIKEVVKAVSNQYNIEEATVYEKTRRREIVHARQVVMYILREEFNVSYPLIGQKLGGKDHTTVIHSCLKIKSELKTNSILSNEIERIKMMLK